MGSIEAKELLEAHAHAWNIMFSFIKSMTLRSAIYLGIAQAIHNNNPNPISLSQLLTSLSLPPQRKDYLRRLMRMLVHLGVFAQISTKEVEEELYATTELSQLIVQEKEARVSPFNVIMEDETVLNPWHDLSSWFKRSDEEDQKGENLFGVGMASDSKFGAQLLIRECGHVFQDLESLVVVGGGDVTIAFELVEAFPSIIKCIVVDLARVVGTLKGNDKVNGVEGDVFHLLPPANAVLLKWVLRLWSDEDCVKILQNCKKAIPSKENGGKIIIVDVCIPKTKDGDNETQLLFDMYFVAHTSGIQRNKDEWTNIFIKAGFKEHKITPFVGSQAIIELFY